MFVSISVYLMMIKYIPYSPTIEAVPTATKCFLTAWKQIFFRLLSFLGSTLLIKSDIVHHQGKYIITDVKTLV